MKIAPLTTSQSSYEDQMRQYEWKPSVKSVRAHCVITCKCAFHYKFRKQWGHSQDNETLRLWELKDNNLMFYRVLSIYHSLFQLKVSSNCQIFDGQVTYVHSKAQDKRPLFNYKQMPGQKEGTVMEVWKAPWDAQFRKRDLQCFPWRSC